MNIYIIYAVLHNGIVERYSPVLCRSDKKEMFKIAKNLKKDTKTYKNVYVICKIFQELDAFVLEV